MELGLVAVATSPFQMAVAMMDMTLGSGLRMEAARKKALALSDHAIPALSINVDSTSYWERPFTGEWLGMRPSVISQKDGITTVSSILYGSQAELAPPWPAGSSDYLRTPRPLKPRNKGESFLQRNRDEPKALQSHLYILAEVVCEYG